jgi:hypothetical protein
MLKACMEQSVRNLRAADPAACCSLVGGGKGFTQQAGMESKHSEM